MTLNPRPGIRIKPLYAWLDTTHVARTQHYWEFIMCGGIGPEGKVSQSAELRA